MPYSIYVLTNSANGKVYVGYTKYTPEQRWDKHQRDRKSKTCRYLYAAIEKHGAECFTVELLDTCETHSEAKQLERHWIAQMHSNDPLVGYNLTAGGDGASGSPRSDETKRKISAANSGEGNGMFGRVPWNRGIPQSEEAKAKASAKLKGRVSPMKGRKLTSEHIEKIRTANVGKVPWSAGKKMSEESKRRMSESRKSYYASLTPEELNDLYASRRGPRKPT